MAAHQPTAQLRADTIRPYEMVRPTHCISGGWDTRKGRPYKVR